MMEILLVNKQNVLPKDYKPSNLVQETNTKIWIQREACSSFCNMNEGINKCDLSSLVLVSGYRSYEYQQQVFERKVNSLIKEGLAKHRAIEKAQTIVALPGTSEHQTGLAMDITNTDLAKKQDPLIEEFADTDHGKWLDLHSQNYGFILRYPKDKTSITNITYEPWHYRYVGIKHAKTIKKLGICLEEYAYYLNKK